MNGINIPQWAKIVMTVGFPIFVALYFMALNVGWISSPLNKIETNFEVHSATTATQGVKLDALIDRITTGLKVICKNGAKDRVALNNCDNIR